MSKKEEDVVIKPSHMRLPHGKVRGIPYNHQTGNMDNTFKDDDDEAENAPKLERKKKGN